MLCAETSGPESLLPERTRQDQPGYQHDENGQCEEDKLPRTGPKETRYCYGLKLRVTVTVASPPAGFGNANCSKYLTTFF
jgi:hypothetical protein